MNHLERLKSGPALSGKITDPIFEAVIAEDMNRLRQITNYQTQSPRVDDFGRSPLHFARSAAMVDELFRSNHADCRAVCDAGFMPIHRAAFTRNAEVIKALCERGSPTRRRVHNFTPAVLIMIAARDDLDDRDRTVECFEELLKSDPRAGQASTEDGRCARDFLHTSGKRSAHDLSRALGHLALPTFDHQVTLRMRGDGFGPLRAPEAAIDIINKSALEPGERDKEEPYQWKPTAKK